MEGGGVGGPHAHPPSATTGTHMHAAAGNRHPTPHGHRPFGCIVTAQCYGLTGNSFNPTPKGVIYLFYYYYIEGGIGLSECITQGVRGPDPGSAPAHEAACLLSSHSNPPARRCAS